MGTSGKRWRACLRVAPTKQYFSPTPNCELKTSPAVSVPTLPCSRAERAAAAQDSPEAVTGTYGRKLGRQRRMSPGGRSRALTAAGTVGHPLPPVPIAGPGTQLVLKNKVAQMNAFSLLILRKLLFFFSKRTLSSEEILWAKFRT